MVAPSERRNIPSSRQSLVFGTATASAGCLRALMPAPAGFAVVFFCLVIVSSVRCVADLMPATHARFLCPLSQADRPIMELRRSPLLDTSMARNNRMHMTISERDLDYLDKWLSSDGSPPK